MSIYGDLSKPQRKILRDLVDVSAVSIDTALLSAGRVQPYEHLASLGFVEFQRRMFRGCSFHAWLTPAGLDVARSAARNACSARYARFRGVGA